MKIFIVLILTLIAIAPSAAQANAQCLPQFDYKDGWLGADDAYSIELPNGKTVWLFGDTFISPNRQQRRFHQRNFDKGSFISNSIAISECVNKKFKAKYYFTDTTNKRDDFFKHPQATEGFKYWPRDGFYHKGKLYIYQFDVKSAVEGGANFILPSTTLTVITNPLDSPDKWHKKYIKQNVPNGILLGATIVKMQDDVYIYATINLPNSTDKPQIKDQPLAVFKSKIKDIHDNSKLEFLNIKNKWQSIEYLKSNVSNLKQVISPGTMEMTIRHNTNLNKWLAIYIGNPFKDSHANYRTADAPHGPWSEPKNLFALPSVNKPNFKDVFCYAAKEHPQYNNKPSDIVLTYVCNSMDMPTILTNKNVYKPIVIKLNTHDLK